MSISQEPLTVLEILDKTTKFFKQKDIENPRLNAERLLSALLEIDRVQLYMQFDRIMSKSETERYREYVRRRSVNEPVQYILGETEFMGLNFKVSPASLIPRPETEILIEKALEIRDLLKIENPKVWDIGTGSGCIAVSLAHYWPECSLIASDISKESLALAEANALSNGVADQIEFIHHNFLTDPIDTLPDIDIVISNPPYISLEEYEKLENEIKLFEPQIALTDNSAGRTFYEKIFSLIEKYPGCNFILVELSGTQTEKITEIAKRYIFSDLKIFKDLNNLPRVLQIEIG